MSARRHSRSTTPPPAPTLPSAPSAPPAPSVPPAPTLPSAPSAPPAPSVPLAPIPLPAPSARSAASAPPIPPLGTTIGGRASTGRPGPVAHRPQEGAADAGAPVAGDDEHAEVGDPAAQAGVDGADDLPAGVGHEHHRVVAGHGPVEAGSAPGAVDRRLGAHPAALGRHRLEGVHVGVEVAGHGPPERERERRRERGRGGRNGGHAPWSPTGHRPRPPFSARPAR